MAERRSASLLDFAIAASLAVVPVMLGMLLLVGVVRPGPAELGGRAPGDRYVSVRHVAALKTFEQAILQRSGTAAAPTAAQVLDGVPKCRREWSGDGSAAGWLRRVAHGDAIEASPAERIAVRLGDLDAALHRFSNRANPRVEHRVGLDATRWFSVADALVDQVVASADYPDRAFRVRCGDLVAALATLGRADARMLDTLAWRGTEGGVALARWRPEQQMEVAARQVARGNPWSGVAGCIYLGGHAAADAAPAPRYFLAGPRSLHQRVCAMPAVAGAPSAVASAAGASMPVPLPLHGEPGNADGLDDTRWRVPPSLQALLQPLQSLRQPSGSLYRLLTDADAEPRADDMRSVLSRAVGSRADGPHAGSRLAANRIVLDGAAVDVGFSVDLTIDPALQALAQKTAACYTGRHEVCHGLGMRRHEDAERPLGQQLLEGAMVRMAAVAVIDVASGRIEALAGALSPCARQEVDGPGRDAACDRRLPYPIQYRPDALLNPAVFHAAMPASTIKPIMAAAFLAEPGAGAGLLAAERQAMRRDGVPARDSLRGQLMRSDSARFLDRMFCQERGFAGCRRAWDVQSAAAAFGWNAGCAVPGIGCGQHDLLFGRAAEPAATTSGTPSLEKPVLYGRLMSEPFGKKLGAPMHLMPPAAFDVQRLRRCATGVDGRRGSDDDWEKCRGGALVDVVAEGWGQGHARASALGIAGMMATLAAAANGQAEVRRPHLVASLHGVGDRMHPALERWGSAAPRPVGLAREAAEVILGGLAFSHRAGTARTACEQVFDARRCREIGWLAGKTGTPSFPSDGLSLDELARLCRPGRAAPADRPGACSSLRPYKWYVAAYRSDGSATGPWTKAIAVLAERNWLQRSGQVHGAGDHGPNPAAEIALQIVGRQAGLIPGVAP
jgi:hypothetical protein